MNVLSAWLLAIAVSPVLHGVSGLRSDSDGRDVFRLLGPEQRERPAPAEAQEVPPRMAERGRNEPQENHGEAGDFSDIPKFLGQLTAIGANIEEWEAAVNANKAAIDAGSEEGEQSSALALDIINVSSFIEGRYHKELTSCPTKWPDKWTVSDSVDQVQIALFTSMESNYCKLVGKGTFGKVYRTSLKCEPDFQVAVKVQQRPQHELHLQETSEVTMMKLFKDSPYFGAYLALATVGNYREKTDYILMELMTGGDLQSHLRIPENKMMRSLNVRLFLEVAKGVKKMHENKVVHRDLKPANVLISSACLGATRKPCHAKVADLGLACRIRQCEGIAGTPLYMSPEMLTQEATLAGDIWALGIMFYEIMALEVPQGLGNARTMDEFKRAIRALNIAKDKYYLRSQRPSVKRLLEGMLNPDATKRCSADYVVEQLPELLRELLEEEQQVPRIAPPSSGLWLPDCWNHGIVEKQPLVELPPRDPPQPARRAILPPVRKPLGQPPTREPSPEVPKVRYVTLRPADFKPFGLFDYVLAVMDAQQGTVKPNVDTLRIRLYGGAEKLQFGDKVTSVTFSDGRAAKYEWIKALSDLTPENNRKGEVLITFNKFRR